jgi:RNA recognition motif-containing protein
LKIYYCPPRPGDVWPPVGGGGGGPSGAGNAPPRAAKNIRPKPPGCRKLFCGNLAYEIDDEVIVNFFSDCGSLTGLRWLTREGTGEFRVSATAVLLSLFCIPFQFNCYHFTHFVVCRDVLLWSLAPQRRLTKVFRRTEKCFSQG